MIYNLGHHAGGYTYSRRPVELKYFEKFTDVNQAISREKQWKGWSRKKKQALFNENWNELKRLSRFLDKYHIRPTFGKLMVTRVKSTYFPC